MTVMSRHLGFCFAVAALWHTSAALAADASPPNVVLIFADDLGYADVGCFGAKDIRTPNIDRLATEGTRFTSFYVSQPVCTASRASLMTGCYANRVGLAGALNHTSKAGIHADEVLLPELLQQRGYATAIFGKWHLGHRPEFSPLRHGFNEFLGIPYSNDNGPLHPVVKTIPSLPWIDGEKTAELDPDQSQFTRRLTERALRFLAANKDRPFFLYLPHIMPHVPIFASEKFKGRSGRGLYGDVVEELDWSVGEIVAALKRLNLEDNTLLIFTSDNGPFLSYGEHAGSATPLREGKLTTFEGGVRTPCLIRWPKIIPAGRTCDEPVASIDLLPTIAKLIDAPVPKHPIDGLDVWPILSGQPDGRTPHEALLFFSGDELQAVRSGDWKLHFAHDYLTVAGPPGKGGKPANYENMKPKSIEESGIRGIASRHGYEVRRIEQSLFNLKDDPGESRDVAKQHPTV
ncbi:MAG: arylsulfatase A family protein, partial [Planctomycetota bacterium]